MQFVSDYMKGIDLIALAALVASAVSLHCIVRGSIWLLVAAIVCSHLGCQSVVWSVLTDLLRAFRFNCDEEISTFRKQIAASPPR